MRNHVYVDVTLTDDAALLDFEKVAEMLKGIEDHFGDVADRIDVYTTPQELLHGARAHRLPRHPVDTTLPPACFASLPGGDGETIAIKRGEYGYSICAGKGGPSADHLNRAIGVTPAQREAMLAGSMFGFDTPAAHASSYDANGNPVKEKRT